LLEEKQGEIRTGKRRTDEREGRSRAYGKKVNNQREKLTGGRERKRPAKEKIRERKKMDTETCG